MWCLCAPMAVTVRDMRRQLGLGRELDGKEVRREGGRKKNREEGRIIEGGGTLRIEIKREK